MIDLEDRIRTSLRDYATSVQPSSPRDDAEAVLDQTVTALHSSPRRDDGRGRRGGRVVMAAAAAALIVTGAAAFVRVAPWGAERAAQSERASQVGTALPPDPPGPLYVLPADLDDVVLGSADRWMWQLSSDVATFDVLAGRPDGSGFVDLVGISVAPWSPMSMADPAEDWTTIETADGTVHVQPSPFFGVVRRQGDLWITVSPRHADLRTEPSSDAIDAAVAVLDAVQLDADGWPTLSEASGLAVIDRYEMPSSAGFTTYYEATTDSVRYVVETGSGGLGLAARVADRIEPIEIGGLEAWVLQEHGPNLRPTGLVWRATPNRIASVDVSTDAPTDIDPEELLTFAEQLVAVSEAEWEAAFSGVDDQCSVLTIDGPPRECVVLPLQ